MNWSAFFQGAPSGFAKGMGETQGMADKYQTYQYNERMHPLQLQHQGLLNQNLSQGIGQTNRENAGYEAFANTYGIPAGLKQPPQGTTPTAQPMGGQSPQSMWDKLNSPAAQGGTGQGLQSLRPFGTPQIPQYDFSQMYNPMIRGVQQGNLPMMPYGMPGGGSVGGMAPPWMNMGGWGY